MTYPIRLDQFLKIARVVGSGGEAKMLIVEGLVRVNCQVEQRRGRKLWQGDTVQVEDGPVREVGSES